MDFLHPSENTDTMDLASSPNMRDDDLDLDYDPMRDPSVEPNLDKMIDDQGHVDTIAAGTTSPGGEAFLNDDNMYDEDVVQQDAEEIPEYNMNLPQLDDVQDVLDDDILYEDEPAIEAEEHDDTTDRNAEIQDEELPDEYEDDLDHVDLTVPAEHQVEFQEQNDPTNVSQGRDTKPSVDVSPIAKDLESPAHDPNQGQADLTPPGDDEAEPESDDPTGVQAGHAAIPPGPDLTDEAATAVHGVQESSHNAQTTTDEHELRHDESFDVAVHPVKVLYHDSEMALFPPYQNDESETFFLADTSLVHETLDKLLSACRDVLAGTIGDDDEMVLDIASMGLHICEGSKYATQLTLSDVLDVYRTLNHNDNIDQPEPLSCVLSSRVCLASQYDYLLLAAQQGRPFTEIVDEHMGHQDEYDVIEAAEQRGSHEEVDDQIETGNEHDAATREAEELPEDKPVIFSTQEHVTSSQKQTGENEAYDAQDADTEGLPPARSHGSASPGKAVTAAPSTHGRANVDDNDASDLTRVDEGAPNLPIENDTEPTTGTNKPEKDQDVTAHKGLPEADLVDFDDDGDDDASSHTLEPERDDQNSKQVHPEGVDWTHQSPNDVESSRDVQSDSLAGADSAAEAGEDQLKTVTDSIAGDHTQLFDEDDLLIFGREDQETNGADQSPEEPLANGPKFLVADQEPDEDLFEDIDDSVIKESANGDATAATKPATPSKSKTTKRKMVDDEDDFDLIEMETPEKKRGRSS